EKGGRGDLKTHQVTMIPYNKRLKPLSRSLRSNMTDAEKLLWSKIRRKQLKGFQFYRQKIIGNYIADFYCPELKLVIEVDGGQHYSAEGGENDRIRDAYITGDGITVIRFSDRDVLKNLKAVLEEIWKRL
ncbi:MAG: endonuclease domain-containing protein, partial [Thermodesulfovibrionales bacterium]|nr:endonuclease domain-containing protein [Thermodesulfovibrionales bacterium]